MKSKVRSLIYYLLRNVKIDFVRYLILKPLFYLDGRTLNGFRSLTNDRFYIYNVEGKYLPSYKLNWFSNYQFFQSSADKISLFDYEINHGDVIIDIGAGMGEEVIVYAERTGPNGIVYAIEANPVVANVLKKVVSLNKFQHVKVFNLAINNVEGNVELSDEDEYIAGTIAHSKNSKKVFNVRGVRMDEFLRENNIEKVDLLKCNIEGAERFLVDSLSQESLRRIKHVAIACHDFRYAEEGNDFFKTKDYIIDFLTSNGFEIKMQQTGIVYIDDYVYGKNKY